MPKTIVITGATGFIGRKLSEQLTARGDRVVVFTRNTAGAEGRVHAAKFVHWNPELEIKGSWIEELKSADAVINLAGESVIGKRWTNEYKSRILESRTITAGALARGLAELNEPRHFISASAIGIYGANQEKTITESSPSAKDFLAVVTDKWEKASEQLAGTEVKRSIIRIGIVLDKYEGALAKMIPPFKFFVGGPIGSGKQWFPWIHIDDLTGIFLHILDSGIDGVFNAVSPGITTMTGFAKQLGKSMRRPAIFPVPEFVLKLALGEAASVATGGAKVIPQNTLRSGYSFKYPELPDALNSFFTRA